MPRHRSEEMHGESGRTFANTSHGQRRVTRQRQQKPKNRSLFEPSQEEQFTEIDPEEYGFAFSNAEIGKTVETIVGLCDGRFDAVTDGSESSSVVRVNDTRAKKMQFVTDLLLAVERMVNNADVQQAAIKAIRDDDKLLRMIEELKSDQIN